MEIGDITRQSLMDIRNGHRFTSMLQAFMERNLDDMPLCRSCDIPFGDRQNPILHSGPSITPSDGAAIRIIDNSDAIIGDEKSSRVLGSITSGVLRVEYPSYGQLSSAISLPPLVANINQGHAVFGQDVRPSHASAKLLIQLVLNAWSVQDNGLVIAFFRDGGPKPAGLVAKPLPRRHSTTFDMTFIITANTLGTIPIMFRIGPWKPGRIFINGDSSGPKQIKPIPFIEITEEARIARPRLIQV